MLNLQIAFYFLIFSRLQVHTNFIKAYFPIIFFLTQLLRFILVFLANQRFVFLICFTVFYKF